jgi:hypothetical protein
LEKIKLFGKKINSYKCFKLQTTLPLYFMSAPKKFTPSVRLAEKFRAEQDEKLKEKQKNEKN